MTITYTLSEYSYLSGCGVCIGSSDSVDRLPFELCDALNTYSVKRGHVDIADFEGCDVNAARSWLEDMFGYDGRCGVAAWKGECSWCGSELYNGECDCEDFVESVDAAEAADIADIERRARLAAYDDCPEYHG